MLHESIFQQQLVYRLAMVECIFQQQLVSRLTMVESTSQQQLVGGRVRERVSQQGLHKVQEP